MTGVVYSSREAHKDGGLDAVALGNDRATDATDSASTSSPSDFLTSVNTRAPEPPTLTVLAASGGNANAPDALANAAAASGELALNYFAPTMPTNLEQEALDQSISKLVGERWTGEADYDPLTWKAFEALNGNIEASFTTLDGGAGYRWYAADGRLELEIIDYGATGKLTKWFGYGKSSENIVEFARGEKGVQRRYFSNLQKRQAHTWSKDETKAFMSYEH